jgi:hypothetical protein
MESTLQFRNLQYGYPSVENAAHLNNATVFDKYFSQFKETGFPENDSIKTYKELKVIQECMEKDFSSKSARVIDIDVMAYYSNQFEKQGINVSQDLLKLIAGEISPLIMRLKMFYQRPRPFQVAWLGKIEILPWGSTSSLSPAYPSGHGAQSRFIALVLSEAFPEKKDWLMKLSEFVAYSRVCMGLHFPSDNVFGQAIAEYLFQTKEGQQLTEDILKNIQK